jgi:hypothetical protein
MMIYLYYQQQTKTTTLERAKAGRLGKRRHDSGPNPKGENPMAFKIGDILTSTWGYEQTNVDFYEVVGTTAKTTEIRKLRKAVLERGSMEGTCFPIMDGYEGGPIRRKTHEWDEPTLRLEPGVFARPWNGKPRRYTEYA